MNEAFLHHLWKFKLFNRNQLETVEGEPVEILKTGQHNTDAGPDFFNAQVKIGKTVWAGNVEIHIKSSDWRKHQHSRDAAYNNVVLHVVFEYDEDVLTRQNRKLPTLELKGRFNPGLFINYLNLLESSTRIPCENYISRVADLIISTWLERMLVERLENKTAAIRECLKQNKNDWEEAFYQFLAKNFGFKTNSLPFELLARSLPINLLSKHKNHLNQVEALLFGQAGLLEKKCKSRYHRELRKEYRFLQKKFNLNPIDPSQWKFLRLRPSNFPTIRIAQFADLLHRRSRLFTQLMKTENLKDFRMLLSAGVSPYWKSHYTFERRSAKKEKTLGNAAFLLIMVNTVIPFLFAYGRHHGNEPLQQRALQLLESLPPEKNTIVALWNEVHITARSAARTQALLHLKNEYCNRKKCLFCSIGKKILDSAS